MAHDIIFGDRRRDWSRGSSCGYSPSCVERPTSLVVQERRGPGILGWSIGIMLGSRLVTGRWPWYWFGKIDRRLGEGKR